MKKANHNSPPFTLKIFVADGDPDGLRLIERSNWTGKGVMFPRALLPEIHTRQEFEQTGVYLLIGPRPDSDGEMIYIGEGDPVRPRLEGHYAKKDFWTRAVFFVAPGHLNKAHIQFLESRMISLASAAKRMPLENCNCPVEPTLSEADHADMEVFLQNILGMLPVLGIHAFEQATKPDAAIDALLLHCSGNGAAATGHDKPNGFVVRAGSSAAVKVTPSLEKHFPHVCELRKDLVKNGVLSLDSGKHVFTQDYAFNSPSLAAAVVLGRSANGRVDWKDASGRTLKQIQQAQTEGSGSKEA